MVPKGDVHTVKVVEPSEEVRLLLAKLLGTVFDTATRNGVLDMLKPYLHNIIVCAHVRRDPCALVWGCARARECVSCCHPCNNAHPAPPTHLLCARHARWTHSLTCGCQGTN